MQYRGLIIALWLLVSDSSLVGAQVIDSLIAVPDSLRPLTLQNFYELILQNHPTAKQANLLPEVARQEIRLARGNFDPKVEAQILSKTFDGNDYYDIFNASLKIPTILPIDPSVGIEKNSGKYLNPERFIAEEYNFRQFYAGISVPLGRGLITDERRTALRQAELFRDLSEAEQIKAINKLLLHAANQYWDWYYAYYNYRLLNRSVAIANEIFERVKLNSAYGEASLIDTVQAKITLQQRQIDQQEALLQFQNSGLDLSAMLWDSLSNPVNLDSKWIPVLEVQSQELAFENLQALADDARLNHPELKAIRIKIKQMEADKRLAAEYLKPQLNLNYYALNQPIDSDGGFAFTGGDNYKLGLDFSFPLFLRKERSKLALTKLKLSNAALEQDIAERQIINNISSTFNELTNLQFTISSQYQMVLNYERLLQAEMVNLDQGESDLFKINVQLEKLIQAQTKWIKLRSENEKRKAYLYWAAGSYRVD